MSTSPSPLSRRSFSLPVTRNTPNTDPQLEILFTLDSARIVAFTTALGSSSRPGSSSGISADDEEVGKLSWVSSFESTIAVGPLRIYRAPGSVAFLNCANALRPILPKSQAWCVDGDSKFVLQIRRPQYWRIEVANKTDEERAKVDLLKRVLGEVLLFEKTPCPFQRDFVVELPEAPATPVTKRPWKPVQGPSPRPVTPLVQETTLDNGYGTTSFGKRASSASPLRQSLLSSRRRNSAMDLGSQIVKSDFEPQPSSKLFSSSTNGSTTTISELEEPVITPHLFETSPLAVAVAVDDLASVQDEAEVSEPEASLNEPDVVNLATSTDSENFSDATDDTDATPRPRGRIQPFFQPVAFAPAKNESQPAARPCSRSAAAPPVLSLITTPPSQQMEASPPISSAVSDSNDSFSSSVESFHTVQSWHSLSPTGSEPSSPRQPHVHSDDLRLPTIPRNPKEVSLLTIMPDPPRIWDLNTTIDANVDRRASTPDPKTPTLINDNSDKSDEEFEIVTPPAVVKQGLRHRATTSSNSRTRQLSPLPAAVNLFSPTRSRPRHLQTARHLPTAIIQKTCEILLSPPSHLFHLMINIASKIAAGEWRGMLLGNGEAVHWDFEDEYATSPGRYQDDYGVNLARPVSEDNRSQMNNSWEID